MTAADTAIGAAYGALGLYACAVLLARTLVPAARQLVDLAFAAARAAARIGARRRAKSKT